MKKYIILSICLCFIIIKPIHIFSQSSIDNRTELLVIKNIQVQNNWISFSPFTIIQVFTLNPWYYCEFGHYYNSKDALVTALDFGRNSNTNSSGYYNFFSLLIGYRHHIWKNLHFQTEILSGYEANYDKDNSFYSEGWNGLTVSIRLGYKFDFNIFKIPVFFNVQVQAINDITKKSFFTFFPACQLGYRF